MKEKVLFVVHPRYVAGAIFRKEDDKPWRLTRVAPMLAWMIGMDLKAIRAVLSRRGALDWEWLDTPKI